MYKIAILIISSRKELSIKYKKLIEGLNQNAIISNNLSGALSIIQKERPEFIIISDTIKEKLSDFIKKIRILTYNNRPVVIAVSKSSDVEDRLLAFESGADDFLGEEISKTEFQMRLKAHLRRYIETSLNPITNIVNKNITQKVLERSLNHENDVAYLLIKIRNLDEYRKTHGEIAYEKILQTLGAIINSTLSKEDFIGHNFENELILITNSFKMEQIASFLTFAFDNILNKFYSQDEFQNNFTIQSSDSTTENRIGLMRLCVSGLEKNETYTNAKDVLNVLYELNNLCRVENSSNYIIDRVKLKGEVLKKQDNKNVLILEPDSALSYLLKNVCELNKINVQLAKDEEDFYFLYEKLTPKVVVLDWGKDKNSSTLKIAKKISKDKIKLIFSSSYLNKKEILKTGADVYIPKPYEVDDMIEWIKKFL